VRALDRNGEVFELGAEGLLAVCIQHEIDHLDGKLFVDQRRGVRAGSRGPVGGMYSTRN
jgi:peptide deformylase